MFNKQSSKKTLKIPHALWLRTRMMVGLRPIYQSLGHLESLFVKQEIVNKKMIKPIYVCGLARSGTTIISQILSEHPETAYHCYSDFPELFFPYWKNWIKKRQLNFQPKLAERSHQDRLLVNNNSIEAFEEVLWMSHFKSMHQDGMCHPPSAERAKSFEKPYKQHIKKLLAVHGKSRYLTKANYNINRIEMILEFFPDARFLIPVRHPINHLASLIKQQNLFTANGSKKINQQLAASGHFEFGAIREIIDCGDTGINQQIRSLWKNNDEIQGWAVYWQHLYTYVLKLKNKSSTLNQAIKLVKYEDLCSDAVSTINSIVEHCHLNLESSQPLINKYAQLISPPEYYVLPFSQSEKNAIMSVTNEVAGHFDYHIDNHL